MDKIDLDAIYNKVYYGYSSKDTEWIAKEAMKQAIHQALILASEKATIEIYEYNRKGEKVGIGNMGQEVVDEHKKCWAADKKSILDVEKLII